MIPPLPVAGDCGWVIAEGDYPGQIMSFIKGVDNQHWRNVKVRGVCCHNQDCL